MTPISCRAMFVCRPVSAWLPTAYVANVPSMTKTSLACRAVLILRGDGSPANPRTPMHVATTSVDVTAMPSRTKCVGSSDLADWPDWTPGDAAYFGPNGTVLRASPTRRPQEVLRRVALGLPMAAGDGAALGSMRFASHPTRTQVIRLAHDTTGGPLASRHGANSPSAVDFTAKACRPVNVVPQYQTTSFRSAAGDFASSSYTWQSFSVVVTPEASRTVSIVFPHPAYSNRSAAGNVTLSPHT